MTTIIKPTDFTTSDYHFGHSNIIEYAHRPFKDIDEMNEKFILNWNTKVPHDGKVYFIGDFCLGKGSEIKKFRDRLNGSICLIRGNHDKGVKGEYLNLFEWVKDYYEAKYEDGTKIIMCHYAFRTWNGSHKESINLFGHSHGSLEDLGNKQFDVGIDNNPKYEPWSFKEIMDKMEKRIFIKVDHHEPRTK